VCACGRAYVLVRACECEFIRLCVSVCVCVRVRMQVCEYVYPGRMC